MLVVGAMRVRNEADLLPLVLEDLKGKLDFIYAVDDGSTDGTLDILNNSPIVKHIKTKDSKWTIERHKTQYLYDKVKQDFGVDDVWVTLLGGDYFFPFETPYDICNIAKEKGFDRVNALVLDFVRHPEQSWEGVDTWPNWHDDIRNICRYCYLVECLPIVWKVEHNVHWGRMPWPRGLSNPQSSPDYVAIVNHYGKRSPRYHQWKYFSGSRAIPRSLVIDDFKNLEKAQRLGNGDQYFRNYNVLPYYGMDTVNELLSLEKLSAEEKKNYFDAIRFMVKHGDNFENK